MFFLESKNQRTFSTAPDSSRIFRHPCAAPLAKVFCFFFSKKKAFLPCLDVNNPPRAGYLERSARVTVAPRGCKAAACGQECDVHAGVFRL
jgi:hypothetical protein